MIANGACNHHSPASQVCDNALHRSIAVVFVFILARPKSYIWALGNRHFFAVTFFSCCGVLNVVPKVFVIKSFRQITVTNLVGYWLPSLLSISEISHTKSCSLDFVIDPKHV